LHDTGRGSLAIKDDNGQILLHCFSCGGAAGDIAGALGFDLADLFQPTANPLKPGKPIAKVWPAKWVLEALDRDLRLAYVLFADIEKGRVPLDHNRAKAADAKKRIGHLISELDRAY